MENSLKCIIIIKTLTLYNPLRSEKASISKMRKGKKLSCSTNSVKDLHLVPLKIFPSVNKSLTLRIAMTTMRGQLETGRSNSDVTIVTILI